MPTYKYLASDENGKQIKGKLEATDQRDVQLRLKESGMYLITADPVKESKTKALKTTVLADFTRQLGSLLGAGVTIVRALNIIADEEGLKPELKSCYTRLLVTVRQGTALSEALEEQGNTFPPLMIYMFRAAEASGNLEETAMRMAEHYDKDTRIAGKMKSAFTYPKILSVLIVLVVVIIMGYVMPQFDELFSTMPSLPLPTQILFGISDFVKTKWWLLIILVIAVVTAMKILLRVPEVKRQKDQLVLSIPAIGPLMKTICTARFARTFSSLYACGISVINALQISRNVIGNSFIEQQFDELIPFVRSGNPLSDGLSAIDGFMKKLPASVRVGEESGQLEDLMAKMADNFDYESEQAMNKLVSYLEPVMIVVMAIIVAFIMIAVIMPIYNSYAYIGK